MSRRSDKHETGIAAGGGEARVLRQKPIPGVDRLGAAAVRRLKHALDAQVGLCGFRGTDGNRFVREPDVRGCGIGFRVDGDHPDAHLAARPDDADGNLAAIRDQDLLHRTSRSGAPCGADASV